MKFAICTKKALTVAVGLALGMGAMAQAQADATAIAFAKNELRNFQIISTAGFTIVGTPTRNTVNNAAFSGFPSQTFSDPQSLGTASSAAQAQSGPNVAFIPKNTYTLASTFLMVGARGDSDTAAGSPFDPAGVPVVRNVAAARAIGGTGASGTSAGRNTAEASITVQTTTTGTITFNFRDIFEYYASSTLNGESANGSISNTFRIANAAGATIFTYAPTAINTGCGSNSGFPPPGTPCHTTSVDNVNGDLFTGTSQDLVAGTYTISLLTRSDANVVVTQLPEPGTILLFGMGLGALSLSMRRRKGA